MQAMKKLAGPRRGEHKEEIDQKVGLLTEIVYHAEILGSVPSRGRERL